MLRLVENEDRARKPSIRQAGATPVSRRAGSQQSGYPCRGGTVLESSARFDFAAGELGVARQDATRDGTAHIQVVELGLPDLSGLGNFPLHGVQVAVFLKPEHNWACGY